MTAGPLQGLRVLDFSTMLAGPYAATLLGDLGADVIKVESHYGDDSRHLGPERDGEHSPFLALNRNKRSLVLDLRKPGAREAFARLLPTTDILITNVREPALSRLGLAYEQVKKHRADIIWIGVTAFGADGPYAGRPGIDFLAQGYAGLLALNGHPGQEPVRVTIPLIDVSTSLLASTAALTALHVRSRTGEGQRIDVSLLDALVHAQAPGLSAYFNCNEVTPKTGNRSQYFSPSGVYTCGDGGKVVITCPSDKFFRNLCEALETDWADDPKFATVAQRLKHEEELDRMIHTRCGKFTQPETLERLIAADVLTAPINDIEQVAQDPQIRHNDMIVETDHARLGRVTVTGVPIHLRGTPGQVRRAPPVHGQHSQEVLQELGYSPSEIESLFEDRSAGRASK